MNAEIIAVGTELLLGDILNTNAQFLARELAALGINVLHQSVVGDNPGRLSEAIEQAVRRSDIVITSGGLGPTGDDLTRETVSSVLGLQLKLHEISMLRIEEYFEKTGRKMSETNRKQAMLPEGAVVFQNDWGTAPGCAVEKFGKIVIMLPGPPREIVPMFVNCVHPFLEKFSKQVIESVNLRVFGIPESDIEELLSDLFEGSNPTLAPYAKEGEVLLRVTARADTKEKARELCRPVCDEINSRLKDAVYGENVDSLQQVVVEKLREKGKKLGIAESCTGGLVSKRITEISGASEVFECGIVSYANRIKEKFLGVDAETLDTYGAVSSQTAAEMAEGARVAASADYGVAITGIAGPSGGTLEKPVGLVYVAVSNGQGCFVKKLLLGHGTMEREHIRYLASSHALDMVRRLVCGLPKSDECVMVPIFEHVEKRSKKPVNGAAAQNVDKSFKGRLKRFIHNTIPMKGDTKKEIFFKILFLIALIVFIVSAAQIITYFAQSFYNKNLTDSVNNLYSQNASAPSQNGIQGSFLKLYAVNKDVKGYLIIPNSQIKFSVVQTKDDSYYLTHDFKKNSNKYGNPFLESNCSIKPMSKNIIIYGHNMHDQQMFHDLTKYRSLDFYKSSPVLTFNTLYKNYKWKVVAAFVTNADAKNGDVFQYLVPNFSSDSDFLNFVTEIRKRSFYNTSVDVNKGDTLLTLSTCDYDFSEERCVVVARMVRPGESLSVGQATVNNKQLMPQIWYKIYGGKAPVYSSGSANDSAETVNYDLPGSISQGGTSSRRSSSGRSSSRSSSSRRHSSSSKASSKPSSSSSSSSKPSSSKPSSSSKPHESSSSQQQSSSTAEPASSKSETSSKAA